MVDIERLAALVAVAAVIIAVPGPSVLFVVSRGIALGRRAALTTVLGNAAGLFVVLVAVVAGLGAIVQRSAVVFTTLKLVGAAYLVFLGVQGIRRRKALPAALRPDQAVRGRTTVRDGFVVTVTNPKSVLLLAAILPQFVDRSAGAVPLQMFVLGMACVLLVLVSDSVWGLLAGTARSWFSRSPRRLELMGGAAGLTMIGLGVQLAVTGRKG